MERYMVDQFDENTYVVLDQEERREVCVCSNYDDREDAKERAREIALLLNEKQQMDLQHRV